MNSTFNNITLLIDIDDTIEDLCIEWCLWLNNKYGTSVKYEDISEWNMAKFFPTLTHEQVFEPLHRENFWYLVKPKLDAIKYIKQLMDDGFIIYLCTTTDYRNVSLKYEAVIKRYFPYIDWSQIIVAHNKKMIKADFLIDDGVHNLENGDFIKILMTAPHNKRYNAEENGMIRVDNWEAIYNIVHNYAKTLIKGENEK